MDRTQPVGIMDSGVGGLTLVPELRRLCPGEDLVYFGDSANCPYGNRSKEEILALSRQTIGFLKEKGVKAVAIACNTISALADILNGENEIEIIGIVEPVCRAVAGSGLGQVGVFATNFTISTEIYTRTLHRYNPRIEVWGQGSPHLAALVDAGAGAEALDGEIRDQLGKLLEAHPVGDVILGCTHYPIILERFQHCYPGVSYLNPAAEQAKALAAHLLERDLANPGKQGSFSVYTSGDTAAYTQVIQKLQLPAPTALHHI